MDRLTEQKPQSGPRRSLSPSAAVNATSSSGSHTSHPRAQRSIQMDPRLQALLAAEGHAAALITAARAKRSDLLRRARTESVAEIEAFRRERAAQYQNKLHEATQLEQFQAKLDESRRAALAQMKERVRAERKSVLDCVVRCVVEQIPVGRRKTSAV